MKRFFSVFVATMLLAIVSPSLCLAVTISTITNIPDPFNNLLAAPNNQTSINYTVSTVTGAAQVEILNSSDVSQRRLYNKLVTGNNISNRWNGRNDMNSVLAVGTYKAKVKVNPELQYQMKIQGQGSYFATPTDMAIDDQGNVYIADTFGHAVQKYSKDGTALWKRGVPGIGSPAKGSIPQFKRPYGIAVHRRYEQLIDCGSAQGFRSFVADREYATGGFGSLYGRQVLFFDNMETDKGWRGTGTLSEWERGNPDASASGGPANAYSGNNAWGTDLNNTYSNNCNQYLYSPTINCSASENITFEFRRWLEVGNNDNAYIHVYNGSGWQQIAAYPASVDDTAWGLVTFNVSTYANNRSNFQIRYQLQSNNSGVDVGWSIDDVLVWVPMVVSTNHSIDNTDFDYLYSKQRAGTANLDYRFTVPAVDTYNVVFHFAEIEYNSAGQRVFDIALEGTTVEDDLDIYTEAGGHDKALIKEYQVRITDGILNIGFPSVTAGKVAVAAIEVKSPLFIYVSDTYNQRIQSLNENGYVQTPNWATVEFPDVAPIDRFLGLDADRDYLYVAYDYGDVGTSPGCEVKVKSYLIRNPATNYSSGRQVWGDVDMAVSIADVAGHDSNSDGYFEDIYATLLWDYYSVNDIIRAPIATRGQPGTLANDASTGTYGPWGMTFDNTGMTKQYFFTDLFNTRIRKMNVVNGGTDTEVSSGGFPFGSDGTGAGQQLRTPCGIAYDQLYQAIWVADSGNNRLKKFDTAGNLLLTLESDSGYTPLSYPTDLCVDTQNNLYVADSGANRIVKFDSGGNLLQTFGTGRWVIEPATDHTVNNTKMNFPEGVAVDTAGNVYVSDTYNERLLKFNAAGSNAGLLNLDEDTAGNPPGSGGVNWFENDWPMGMDISANRVIWLNNEDTQSRIKWCALNLTGTAYTNVVIGADQNNDNSDVSSDYMWSRVWGTMQQARRLSYFNIASGAGATNMFGGAAVFFNGLAKDNWNNLFASREDDNRIYVYRIYDTAWPNPNLQTIGSVTTTLMHAYGGSGDGNGEFYTPSGLAITYPDESGDRYLWVADSQNNRIQKLKIVYDDEETEMITIATGAGAPNVNSVSLTGPGVTYYDGQYYARTGLVTFNVTFSESMSTTNNPVVKFVANGVDTFITKVSYATNTWIGTANIISGNDDPIADFYISGAKDTTGVMMSPNPNTSFNFVLDTTAPVAPSVYQPDSPQTQTPIVVEGLAESNSVVNVYNFDASSGGSAISAQLGINAGVDGSFTALSIDLNTPPPNYNYIFATATDRAGNVSAASTPRREVYYSAGDPGNGSITPDTSAMAGATDTWTIRYTATATMGNGSKVDIAIPSGWTAPNEVSGIAGYTTVAAGTGMTLVASPNDITASGQMITVNFNACSAGAYFDVTYGSTSGGGPGSTIGAGAAFGSNPFNMWSSNSGSSMQALGSSPYIVVTGEPTKVSYATTMPGSIYKGETGVKAMTLTFQNDNVDAHIEVRSLNLSCWNSVNTGIVPSTALSRVVVKDLGTTYVTKTSIESSGSKVYLDMTTSPIVVENGTNKTVDIYLDIKGAATATSQY